MRRKETRTRDNFSFLTLNINYDLKCISLKFRLFSDIKECKFRHEKNFSTKQSMPQKNPWFPQAHALQRRSRCYQASPGQGQKAFGSNSHYQIVLFSGDY